MNSKSKRATGQRSTRTEESTGWRWKVERTWWATQSEVDGPSRSVSEAIVEWRPSWIQCWPVEDTERRWPARISTSTWPTKDRHEPERMAKVFDVIGRVRFDLLLLMIVVWKRRVTMSFLRWKTRVRRAKSTWWRDSWMSREGHSTTCLFNCDEIPAGAEGVGRRERPKPFGC